MPQLEALYNKYGAKGIEVVIVDASNRKRLTEKVISEASVSLPVLLDDKDISDKDYGVYATPTTLIVDSAGRIVFRHIGYGQGMERMFEKEIELLLQRSAS